VEVDYQTNCVICGVQVDSRRNCTVQTASEKSASKEGWRAESDVDIESGDYGSVFLVVMGMTAEAI